MRRHATPAVLFFDGSQEFKFIIVFNPLYTSKREILLSSQAHACPRYAISTALKFCKLFLFVLAMIDNCHRFLKYWRSKCCMKCCLLTVIAFQKLPKGMPILQSDCLQAGLLAKQLGQIYSDFKMFVKISRQRGSLDSANFALPGNHTIAKVY